MQMGISSEEDSPAARAQVNYDQSPVENNLPSAITDEMDTVLGGTDETSAFVRTPSKFENGSVEEVKPELAKLLDDSSPVKFEISQQKEEETIESDLPAGVDSLDISNARRWTILALLWAGQFLIFVSICALAPFFPKEAEMKNATATEYGLVIGVFQLATLISCPVFAKAVVYIDEKLLVVCGLALASTATLAFGFIDRLAPGMSYLSVAFALRIADGIGAASFQVTSYIVVAAIFPHRIATSFAAMETAVGLGFIAGPAFGALLYEFGGFFLPFVIVGSAMLLVTLLCIILIPKPDGKRPEKSRGIIRFMLSYTAVIFVLAVITNEFNSGFMAAALEPHLRPFNLRVLIVGLIFTAEGACYAVTTPIWGYVNDKRDFTVPSCIIGCLLCILGTAFVGPLSFLPIETSIWLVTLSITLCGLGIAAKMVSAFSGMLQEASSRGYPSDRVTYAMVSAIFNCACAVGASLGPATGGYLLDTVGFREGTVYLFIAEIILWVMFIIQLYRCRKVEEPRSESVKV